MRLENASWRAWWKQKNELKTVNPEILNWFKDSDVTWLYGPLTTVVEWTPPLKPLRDHTVWEATSARDRLDLSLPKHKSILKYRTISELLTRELPFSPVFSPPESDGRADVASSQDTFESSSRRPGLPHTKSNTDITRWQPGRTFCKDSPSRVEPPGNAGASTTNPSTTANSRQPTPTRVSSSTIFTGLHGPSSQTPLQTLTSSTPNSASTSHCDASSKLSSVPTPKKKHVTFNTFVEQCIAIENPKTLGSGAGKGVYGPYDDIDRDAEEHDDGYEEDEQGGDGYDPDWDLNECLITDSDSDSDWEEIQDEDDADDEDDGGFDEIRVSRTTKQAGSKKESLWWKPIASIPSSSTEDSYASRSTSSSIKKRRPSIPTISRRRRSDTGVENLSRSNSNATTRPSLSHSSRRNSDVTSNQMVTIAHIAPTILKTGGSHIFACPTQYPACNGFCIHPDATSGTDEFGDETLSEDGGFGGPIGRYNGYSDNWRSSDSESSGTLVEFVYRPPPLGRYSSAFGGRSSSNRAGSRGGGKRRSGQDEEHGQTSQSLDSWKEQQRPQSPEDVNFGKERGESLKVYDHQKVMFG
ncbi:hypothetical protein L218DRAFT_358215 [Marasmius fiardii PR-910]|nr:hypothetical protein L218DRAFT_358215 [Marasmius fiardii PR-910]